MTPGAGSGAAVAAPGRPGALVTRLAVLEDAPAMDRFRAELFGQAAAPNLVAWKHFGGPHGAPRTVITLDGPRIVGMTGYLPWRLVASGRPLRALHGVDLGLLPGYRGFAIQRRHTAGVIDALKADPPEVAFGTSVRQVAEDGVALSESVSLGPPPRWLGILDLERWLAWKRAPRWLSPLRRLARPLVEMSPPRGPAAACVVVERPALDDPRLDRFAAALGQRPRLATLRDRAHLGWRYDRHPHARFHRFTAEAAGEVLGLAVVHYNEPTRRGFLMEIAATNTDAGGPCDAVLARAVERLRALGAHSVAAWGSPGAPETESLRRAGLRPWRESGRLMTAGGAAPPAGIPWTRPEGWSLSYGDVDDV